MREIKKQYLIGIILGFVILMIFLIFTHGNLKVFGIGIGILIIVLPYVFGVAKESRDQAEKENMFLEFSRNLVESVKAGTPISKSIVNMKGKAYGSLDKNINKLASQISLGIPLNAALRIFAKDINNRVITRAITLIGEAERAGGDIGEILEAVTSAVNTADKLKKERKAAVSALVIQGYIIFAVFIVIMLVMQFQILPMLSGIANIGDIGIGGFGGGEVVSSFDIANIFLYLLLVQGFFSGLTIGKLAEGNIKYGVKHSFILMVASFLITTGANTIIGGFGAQ